jgi:arabinogalactan endo-1,4-beta-galactosidase
MFFRLERSDRAIVLILLFLFAMIPGPLEAIQEPPFIKGADISFVQEIEDHGGQYYEDGQSRDLLEILKDHGFNYIRLRIWHTPSGGYNDLSHTLSMATRIKQEGFGFLLDFHYSDWWADPGQQNKPASWSSLDFETLKDSVYQYSYYVIDALRDQGTLPDIVQIGNEVICGMLWNDGRVCGSYNTTQQWSQFAQLVDEGIRGVKDAAFGDSVRIMIHIDRGASISGTEWFLNNLLSYGVDFDIIGQSYYPWWHGTLSEVEANLQHTVQDYGKDIVIVEAAYPWTLDWFDYQHNIVGDSSQLHEGYPATPEGQRSFLNDLMEIIGDTPNGKGRGIFYWSPEHISVPGVESPWENLALFDFYGNVLESIEAFETNPTGIITHKKDRVTTGSVRAYPNPFNPVTTLEFELSRSSPVTVEVFDVFGRRVRFLLDGDYPAGRWTVKWDGRNDAGDAVSSGLYFAVLRTGENEHSSKILHLR